MTKLLALMTKSKGNFITGIIIIAGLIVTVLRFTGGLGMVTNLDDNNPWGIWISFDLLCGVALAAGGYCTSAACYLFGMKRYHSAVRPAITTAFLGYLFVVIALGYDVGQPWRLPYPIFLSPGTTSVLFEVGLCVCIYLSVLFVEFSVAPLEWLGIRNLRNFVMKLTIPLTILGVVLSTMHQSSLGALYLIAPSKMHPLWYSSFLPVFFFVSSWVAGTGMVILEGSLAHKAMHQYMDDVHNREAEGVILGFGKAGSFILFGYFCIRVFDMAMSNTWSYLATSYGQLWMIEIICFVLLPSFIYALGVREKNIQLIRLGSFFAVGGVVLNRFIVSLVAFNWQLPSDERYFPSLMEICISLFVVTLIVTSYRFICSRMPVLFEHKGFQEDHAAREYKGKHH